MASSSGDFEHSFKILLVGDSGVGKSSLLLRFTTDAFDDHSPTIVSANELAEPSLITVTTKRLDDYQTIAVTKCGFQIEANDSWRTKIEINDLGHRLSIKKAMHNFIRSCAMCWEPGQERFRTLTSSYYRGAQGIILVYDVTRRDTFTNLSEMWLKEIDLYITNQDCVKMLVGNKVDRESERAVSKDEGIEFARHHGCLFLECSAKMSINVQNCFEELVSKIFETPSLLEEDAGPENKSILNREAQDDANISSCC